MEVDEGASSSVLTSTPSSVSVSLHPLVVMNISDHFTRVRMQQEDSTKPPRGVFYIKHTAQVSHVHTMHVYTLPIKFMELSLGYKKAVRLKFAIHLSC